MAVGSPDSDQANETSHGPHRPIAARSAVTRQKRGTSVETGEDLRILHTSEDFFFTFTTPRQPPTRSVIVQCGRLTAYLITTAT